MPFSQYLLMARYINDIYKADYIVCFVGRGDLTGSVANFTNNPISMQLTINKKGEIAERLPKVHNPSKMRVLYNSSIVRYLISNAGMTLGIAKADNEKVKSNVSDLKVDQKSIARYIIERLYAENPSTKFIFLVDGPRDEIYRGDLVVKSLEESLIIGELTKELGGKCIDLREAFENDYLQHGKMFNFPNNYHWNSYGNELVAVEIADILAEY